MLNNETRRRIKDALVELAFIVTVLTTLAVMVTFVYFRVTLAH